MIDASQNIVSSLSTILPCYLELFVDSSTPVPSISYMPTANNINKQGDTMEYSNIKYMIKIYCKGMSSLVTYQNSVDIAMRNLGYKRDSNKLLTMTGSDILTDVLTYSALGKEYY